MNIATNHALPNSVWKSEPIVQSWSHHIYATLRLALPLVGAKIAQVTIKTTDVLMMGWYGTNELAATVLAAQILFFFYAFGSGFTYAMMPVVAQNHGSGDKRQVRRSVRMGLWVVILYSVMCMPILWFIEPLLIASGQSEDISALAGDYMRIAQWALMPMMCVIALRAFFSALSKPQIVLWATVLSALMNGVLNYAFIFGNLGAPELGIAGAAIATVISVLSSLSVLLAWIYIVPQFRSYNIFSRFWKPNWKAFFEVVKMGLHVSITIVAENSIFLIATILTGLLGSVYLATNGIVLQLLSIFFMIPVSLSVVATVRIGQAYGQRDVLNLTRAASVVTGLAVIASMGSSLMFWFIPDFLIGLFLDASNPDADLVMEVGRTLLMVIAFFQVIDAVQVVYAGLLRGIKDTKVPMYFAVLSYWIVGIPMAWLIAFEMKVGITGIWGGMIIGFLIASITLGWRYYKKERQLIKSALIAC